MTDSAQIAALSQAFADVVRSWCTAEEFAEIRRRNATPEYIAACASHDFMDSNMAMLEAFESVIGREMDLTAETDIALMNAAWFQARKESL